MASPAHTVMHCRIVSAMATGSAAIIWQDRPASRCNKLAQGLCELLGVMAGVLPGGAHP